MTAQPERYTADTITSDALDQLYARLDELDTATRPATDRKALRRRYADIITGTYWDLRFVAEELGDRLATARDEHIAELETRVAELTAGQCTHALAVCEQHHRVPVAGCPYPRCRAAAARTATTTTEV